MPFRYKTNVIDVLRDAGYTTTKIRKDKLLGESYMTQLRRGEMVSWAALDTICQLTRLQPGDLIEWIQGAPEGETARPVVGR